MSRVKAAETKNALVGLLLIGAGVFDVLESLEKGESLVVAAKAAIRKSKKRQRKVKKILREEIEVSSADETETSKVNGKPAHEDLQVKS